jgi:hypothetical protein
MTFAIRLLLIALCALPCSYVYASEDNTWYQYLDDGSVELKLWFFWSKRCSHCQDALPVVEKLAAEHHWLRLEDRELIDSRNNRKEFERMASLFAAEARSVPTFFFCKTMLVGFESEDTTGRNILQRLHECRRALEKQQAMPAPTLTQHDAISQSIGLDTDNLSLPALTIIIAGLDAFNPCAFFVLLFLLSLMIHVRSRKRMLLVGGVFVFFSGLIYFVFMSAWLNLFLMSGTVRWVTAVAGLVAVIMGALNIKDYFYAGGPTLSIPDKAKPGLIGRMKKLISTESLPAMLVGTVLLAIAANSYELLCTSGLPMVYTRILTLENLPTTQYYLYLVFYNIIYVIPLLLIVIIFVFTLGSRKLQAHEGRALKLLSGMMMFTLGLVLLFFPDLLSNLKVIFGLICTAIVVSLIAYRFGNKTRKA